jgi:tRNA dimethylallyltransferase
MSNSHASAPPVVMLMGPTASGKTALAVELVQQLPFEIISVDSALIYRGMDIGTAKPDPHVLAQAPHRLIDLLDPAEAYSAAQFRADALREIEAIRAAGRIPLLVGGTMLYFRALERGLADLPRADTTLRARLAAEAAERGLGVLHARLAKLDPTAAARIHRNDPQRILRALEVIELSGQPMTALLARGHGEPFPYRVAKWVIVPSDRDRLHRRIELRFRQMLRDGFVEEVKRLRARADLTAELPSMRAVGYRQVWRYLDGAYDDVAMTRQGIIATRQFAKRQLTWLRREQDAAWFECEDAQLVTKLRRRAEALLV